MLCNTIFASVQTSTRPRVKNSQRNLDESFLYDTGAQRTCMPFNAFKRIHWPEFLKKTKQIHENLNIKDAGGNDLGYKGTFLVEMEIFGRQVEHIVSVGRVTILLLHILCTAVNKHKSIETKTKTQQNREVTEMLQISCSKKEKYHRISTN